jgi:hypothetical protein
MTTPSTPNTPNTPPDPAGTPARERHLPGTRGAAAAAALLNAGGLGAGYLFAGVSGIAVVTWFVTALLVAGALVLNASDAPWLWGPLFLLWLLVMVRGGWKWVRDPRVPKPDRLRRRRPVAAWAAGAALLVLVAGGLTALRGVPAAALDDGRRAQAAGDCAEAADHYARATSAWYEVTLSPAIGEARRDRDACALLTGARQRAEAGEADPAAQAYREYLAAYETGGVPDWAGDHLAAVRLEYADHLAGLALAEDGDEDPGRYVPPVEAYAALAERYQGSPAAGEVPARVDELYATGTEAFGAERYCDAVGQLRLFTGLDDASRTEQAADLAARAGASLGQAAFGCGEQRAADGDACGAIDAYQDATGDEEFGDRAERAVHQSRYDCGRQRAGDGDACGAIDVLEQVGGDLAGRATTALRAALYDCGERRYADGDTAGAREALRQLVDDHAGSAEARDAEDVLIAIEIEEITDGGSGELPQPTEAGSAPGGSARVEIVNASEEALEILYTGPSTGRITVDAGSGGMAACSAAGSLPSVTLDLAPGDYTVVARATSDESVTPYSGAWDLGSGVAYSDCYYIETSFGYGY